MDFNKIKITIDFKMNGKVQKKEFNTDNLLVYLGIEQDGKKGIETFCSSDVNHKFMFLRATFSHLTDEVRTMDANIHEKFALLMTFLEIIKQGKEEMKDYLKEVNNLRENNTEQNLN